MFNHKIKKDKREAFLRSNLLERLKEAIQSVLQPSRSQYSSKVILGHCDNTNILCNVLEAVFIHGLRDTFGERMSSLFIGDPDRMPVPNFWPVILIISHRDLMEQIDKLSYITSEVGKSRAWIRLALNECQVGSYLSVLSGETKTLKEYYKPYSFLRDSECCDIMARVLQPVSNINFNLAINSAVLNTWTQTPLALAGVWTPTSALQGASIDPVLAATDVASTVMDEESHGISIPEPDNPISDVMFQLIIGGTPETSFINENASNTDNTVSPISDNNDDEVFSDETTKNLSKVLSKISVKQNQPDENDESNCISSNTIPEDNSNSKADNQTDESNKCHFETVSLTSECEQTTSSMLNQPNTRQSTDSFCDNESFTRTISVIADDSEYCDLFNTIQATESSSGIPPLLTVPQIQRNLLDDDIGYPNQVSKNFFSKV